MKKKEILWSENEPSDKDVLWLSRKEDLLVLQSYDVNGWEPIGSTAKQEPEIEEIVISDLVINKDSTIIQDDPITISYTLKSGSPTEFMFWIDENPLRYWRPLSELNTLMPVVEIGLHQVSFKVRYKDIESNTLTVSYEGLPKSDIVADNIICFANYPSNVSNLDKNYLDSLYGGYINCNMMNFISNLPLWSILSKSGKDNPDVRFMTEEEKLTYSGLEGINTWTSSRNMTGDLSSVFSLINDNGGFYTLEYNYVYSYSNPRESLWGIHIPNGQYKVRLLSCSNERIDKYDNATIKINKQEVSIPGGSVPYYNNTEWTDYIPVSVTDGKLTIWFSTVAQKRAGINAIEVVKI